MMSVSNIVRSVYRLREGCTSDKLNILTLCKYSEKYISLLSQTGHNFFIPPTHTWTDIIATRPSNVQTLNAISTPLDFVVCYDRGEQYDEAQQISQKLHIPIVLVDMCSRDSVKPHSILENLHVKDPTALLKHPSLTICCNEYIQTSWNASHSVVIPIGIDIEKFKSNRSVDQSLIAIDNQVPPQVGAIIAANLQNRYPVLPTDHTNANDITVNKTKYFINTQQHVTIKMLEAMSAENVVICLKTKDIQEFVQESQCVMWLEKLEMLSSVIDTLEYEDKDLAIQISQNARKKIVNDHSMEKFLSQWNETLNVNKHSFYKANF